MDDKIIENLKLTKTWQHVINGSFPRGSALVEMSGDSWLLLVQGEPKKESFTILSTLRKTFWVVDAMSPSVTRKEN